MGHGAPSKQPGLGNTGLRPYSAKVANLPATSTSGRRRKGQASSFAVCVTAGAGWTTRKCRPAYKYRKGFA